MPGRSVPPLEGAPPHFPLLVLLVAGSGCAALMYEIVWFQQLQLVIGASAFSVGVLLAAFMGGMCVGSLGIPRVLDRITAHPLQVYAVLEIAMGGCALLLLHGLPLVDDLYGAIGGGLLVRALVAMLALLPPTALMGATLPVLARYVRTSPAGAARMGLLYGVNIAGATCGTILAGFYLLPDYDTAVATYAAVLLNVIVAAGAWRIGAVAPAVQPESSTAQPPHATSVPPAIYAVVTISGITSLAAQVIWTRQLALMFGGTAYVFSLILAVFLVGLGVGSGVGAAIARHVDARRALGWCQLLIAAALAWAAFLLNDALPVWPIDPSINPDRGVTLQLDLFRAIWVVLPGACLWGASFPLALVAASSSIEPSRLMGRLSAASTLGAMSGALLAGPVVAAAGSQRLQQALIVLSAASALLAIVRARADGEPRWRIAIAIVVVLVAAGSLVRSVSPVSDLLVAYGRHSATWAGLTRTLYVGEGLHASIAVTRAADGVLTYHSAGKVQASTLPEDMRLQRMLGHFSHLIPTSPKRVLVIGFGAGVTAGAVASAPGVEHVTIAEIEPLVATSVSSHFADYNDHVSDNPRTTVHVDDARHFLSTTRETFDVITSDLVDPWVKGTAALFTQEFFELARRRLNPGGVVTMFVQLYQTSAATVKTEIGTFVRVFPHAIIWGNPNEGRGYDLVLTAQVEPTRIDIDAWQARLDSAAYAGVARSLREIGITSAVDLLSRYAGTGQDLSTWLAGAEINRDRNLRLQYLAGRDVDVQQAGSIYAEMLQYGRVPPALFSGTPASIDAVRRAIAQQAGR